MRYLFEIDGHLQKAGSVTNLQEIFLNSLENIKLHRAQLVIHMLSNLLPFHC
jgi:hypothetical protein